MINKLLIPVKFSRFISEIWLKWIYTSAQNIIANDIEHVPVLFYFFKLRN